MPEIDKAALARLTNSDEAEAPELDKEREVPVWEHPDAPKGSTAESLLVYEKGQPVRVAGPTHYHHLANGQVLGGYGIGTHHSEADPNGGPDILTPIIGVYGG